MKCSFDPAKPPYDIAPIGMFHCPECGEMVVAGIPHPDYEKEESFMKTKFLDKVLKNHSPWCRIFVFSDGDNRHCSCGKDGATIEKDVLASGFEWLLKAYEWFDEHDSMSVNSTAYKELEGIVKRATENKMCRLR